MPPDNTPPPSTKDQENSDSKKITTKPTPEHGAKCPRCDSPNTKFCYYNNYSLTQPRHFCKTCRRYWTNGGALRNVPIGGGCRKKIKKVKTSSSSSTSSLSILSYDSNKDSASSSFSSSQFRFFHGLNSPSLEFQLGGLLPFHHHHHHQPSFTTGIYNNNQFSSIGEVSNSNTLSASSFQLDPSGGGGSSNSLMGINYPALSGFNGGNAIQGMNMNSSLASSIESLSSINQDLHLKLQQQRLATMFGGDNSNQKEEGSSVSLSQVINLENQTLKPQPLLFQNLEISKPEMVQDGNNSRKEGTSGDAPTMEWFFGNSNYCSVTPAATTNGNTNDHDNANNNWSNGVNGWGNVQQPYSALP